STSWMSRPVAGLINSTARSLSPYERPPPRSRRQPSSTLVTGSLPRPVPPTPDRRGGQPHDRRGGQRHDRRGGPHHNRRSGQPYSRSKPRVSSQSVTAASNAASSTRALFA